MEQDLNTIRELLIKYIKVIVKDYGDFIEKRPLALAIKNSTKLVSFDETDSISFFVKKRRLSLPKLTYEIFPILMQDEKYNTNKENRKTKEEFLDTNNTYEDYINHLIETGSTPLSFFKENLLHEAFHICGSVGDSSLEEGITELKTRELAMKYGIRISGYAYPKEVEIAKKLQEIFGKEILDELTFLKIEDRLDFLEDRLGKNARDLYEELSTDMRIASKSYFNKISSIRNPYDKAFTYSLIDYSSSKKIIDKYQKNKTL